MKFWQSSEAEPSDLDLFDQWLGCCFKCCFQFFTSVLLLFLTVAFVLKGIVELHKEGVFASALIKKRRYWPKYIHGDEVKEHFNDKEVGDADSWGGKLECVPFHVFAMKEPDYVMSLMST